MIKKWTFAVVFNLILWNFILGNVQMHAGVSDDLSLGVRYDAHQRVVNRVEGYAVNYTNNLGFLDKEFTSGEKNILVLGDSITEGNQVKRDQTYAGILDSQMDFRVYNLGISGKNAADHIAYGEQYMDFFSPELVIVEITYRDLLDSFSPFSSNAYYDRDDQLVKVEEFETIFTIKNRMKSINPFLFNSYIKIKQYLKSNYKNTAQEKLIVKSVDYGESVDEYKAAFIIDELKRVYGQKLVLVFMSMIELDDQVSGQNGNGLDIEYGRWMASYCENEGILFIDVTQALTGHYSETGELVNGFSNLRLGSGHLNKTGHRVVATQILADLESFDGLLEEKE